MMNSNIQIDLVAIQPTYYIPSTTVCEGQANVVLLPSVMLEKYWILTFVIFLYAICLVLKILLTHLCRF